MLITVIIVNFNSSADLIEAASSLEESLVPKRFDRHVVIVENGSRDPNGEWAALQVLQKYPDVELIKSEVNTGFTGGHNLGIKTHPESDFYLLLNPDTKVDKNFLVELIKPFLVQRHSGDPAGAGDSRIDSGHGQNDEKLIGLASPKIFFYPGFEFHKERYSKKDQGRVIWFAGGVVDWANCVAGGRHVDEIDNSRHPGGRRPIGSSREIDSIALLQNDVQKSDFATGCCLLISRAVVEKIGLLDQKLFFSWEDTDYSQRAKRAGFDIIYAPKSVIWHKNAATSGGPGSPLQDFYQTRNRLIFAFRYAPLKVRLLLLWQLIQTADLNRLKAIASAILILFTHSRAK